MAVSDEALKKTEKKYKQRMARIKDALQDVRRSDIDWSILSRTQKFEYLCETLGEKNITPGAFRTTDDALDDPLARDIPDGIYAPLYGFTLRTQALSTREGALAALAEAVALSHHFSVYEQKEGALMMSQFAAAATPNYPTLADWLNIEPMEKAGKDVLATVYPEATNMFDSGVAYWRSKSGGRAMPADRYQQWLAKAMPNAGSAGLWQPRVIEGDRPGKPKPPQ